MRAVVDDGVPVEVDARHHLHRQGRRRDEGARAGPLPRARPARGRARGGERLDLHDPRLLRPAAAHARAVRRASTPTTRCSTGSRPSGWRWTPSTARSRTSSGRGGDRSGEPGPARAGGLLHARRRCATWCAPRTRTCAAAGAAPEPRAGGAPAAGGRGRARWRPRRARRWPSWAPRTGRRRSEASERSVAASRCSRRLAGRAAGHARAAQATGAGQGQRQGALHRRLRGIPGGSAAYSALCLAPRAPAHRALLRVLLELLRPTATSEAKQARSAPRLRGPRAAGARPAGAATRGCASSTPRASRT